jgi:hypothetical protein
MSDSFIDLKYSNISRYNFDLKELTNDFSFFNFVDKASRTQSFDFGGFGVITSKQYIMGYNSNYGLGTHNCSYGRFMEDINGGGQLYSECDVNYLAEQCKSKFITIRMSYEVGVPNDQGVSGHFGSLRFQIPNRKISLNEYKLFEQFYNEYNEDIKMAIERSKGKLTVSFFSKQIGSIICNNGIDKLLAFLKSNIDYDMVDDNGNEIIVGTEFKNEIQLKR